MHDHQNDSYLSPAKSEKTELKVKDSRFIAHIYPISSEEEAMNFIQKAGLKYNDATHHCYAFKLETGNQTKFRYNDAGEPSGTAGSAIFSVINHTGLNNVVLIVTRYFGGTKLGIGPLRRAYRDSAKAVIEKCGYVKRYHTCRFSFSVPFTALKKIERLLRTVGANIVSQKYEEVAKYIVDVRRSLINEFQEKMEQITKGISPTPVKDDRKIK